MQNSPLINIQDYEDLWLFSLMNYSSQDTLHELSSIMFEHTSEQIELNIHKFLKNIHDKKVTVRIKSENSIDPEPFKDTIEDIMTEAKKLY